ncbi:MAG: HAD family hydrolase [Candidatus Aenigmarchaeota archaeon]|nr:HAD family hydrolase [Candidatus Aenigmarchaeota archaeon]
MEITQFEDRLFGCKAALLDVDGTLVDGSVSEGIGKGYLTREWERGNYRNAARGLLGALKTVFYTKLMGDEQRAYEEFAAALNRVGCVDSESASRFAEAYVKKHGLPYASDFVKFLNGVGMTTIAYTGGIDVSARAASERFGTIAHLGNYSVFGSEIAPNVWSHVPGRKPNKRLTAEKFLDKRFGLKLNDCLVVGDAETDPGVMAGAKLSLAAPLAKPDVRAAADFWALSYEALLKALD